MTELLGAWSDIGSRGAKAERALIEYLKNRPRAEQWRDHGGHTDFGGVPDLVRGVQAEEECDFDGEHL